MKYNCDKTTIVQIDKPTGDSQTVPINGEISIEFAEGMCIISTAGKNILVLAVPQQYVTIVSGDKKTK